MYINDMYNENPYCNAPSKQVIPQAFRDQIRLWITTKLCYTPNFLCSVTLTMGVNAQMTFSGLEIMQSLTDIITTIVDPVPRFD